jgi:hypothetical protein
MAVWSILLPFGLFSIYLLYFVVILYIFSRFGMLHQEKSGNPDLDDAWSKPFYSIGRFWQIYGRRRAGLCFPVTSRDDLFTVTSREVFFKVKLADGFFSTVTSREFFHGI